jgi:hypothetical protein
MANPKATTPASLTAHLTAQERVILFCAATGIDHAAVGIVARAMQAMAIQGLIEHDTGTYVLTDTGRAGFAALLERAGIQVTDTRRGPE